MHPSRSTDTFSLADLKHLEAAQGWLELGLPLEANQELDRVGSQFQGSAAVLELRWHIQSHQQRWEACLEIARSAVESLPEQAFGWIHRSFALHELKRTQEALDHLLPAADRFTDIWTIPYNLACYCSVLQRFDEGRSWLKRALELNKQEVQKAALDDPDLQPLLSRLAKPKA